MFSYDEQNFTTPDIVEIKGSKYDSVSYVQCMVLCVYNALWFIHILLSPECIN